MLGILANWGPAPLFGYEVGRASARWLVFAVRVGVAGSLLAALAFWNAVILPWAQRAEQLNQAAEWYFYLTIGTQLVLVLLAAPAATVGALDTDRRRGVLIHLLASDLSGPDIIVSKLAARLPQVVGLVLAGVPIL